jgi:FtsX-like permease family protein/MacB-like protein
MDTLRADLRYSVRQLRQYPVFAATAVLTLALGIGPNAAIGTIVSSVFRPLPVPDAHELAVLATTLPGNPRIWQRVAYPDYQDYRSSSAAFSDMAAWDLNPVGLTADGRTDRLMATVVSGNYFSTLRVDPAAGRLILPADGELGGTQPIVVLSHSYWMRRFGGSASLVGRDVRIDGRPFSNSTPYVAADGQPAPSSATGILVDRHFVTGDYFQTIGTPVVRGRTFNTGDTSGSPKVAVINEALAARLWPGADPVGQRFRSSADPDSRFEVIGVARDARYRRSEIGGPAVPRYFVSLDQFNLSMRTVHVRSRSATAETLAAAVSATVRRLDPAVPVYDVHTLERQIGDSGAGFGGPKAAAMITGALGVLALLLALVGTYGVLSFTVRARAREIGIRMALGFEPSRVFRMLLCETWRIALIGLVIGLAVSVAAAKALQGFLFRVAPYDPITLIAVVVVMGAVSTIVGFLPARRAARVNPIETLRYE